VFAENDGIVTRRMTDLEREWRRLSRSDPDGRLMDLWTRVAPVSWVDRKRWRDSEPAAQLDATIALAADVEGVETAESAIGALRVALAAWGIPIGFRMRWRSFEHDSDRTTELLAKPLGAACEALSAQGLESVVVLRAQRLERMFTKRRSSDSPNAPCWREVWRMRHSSMASGEPRRSPRVRIP